MSAVRLNRMMVNPETQKERTKYKTQSFVPFLNIMDEINARKGPRTHTMSPPLQD
jgi:hypothetical protein